MFKNTFCKELLAFLLKKYEGSKAFYTGDPTKQRPQISFNRQHPFTKDYDDEMDFYKREWMHQVLLELEQDNIITIAWERYKEGEQISKVYLNYEHITEAYKRANMQPKIEKLNRLMTIFKPLSDHQWEWIRSWADSIIQDLQQRKQARLNLGEIESYKDVVKVLFYLPTIDGNIPKRVFSQKLFADSKHFEQIVEQPLTSIINKAYPTEFESNEELLAYFGIVQQLRLVLFSGHLEWLTEEKSIVSSQNFIGGLGIANVTVSNMVITEVNADRIVLVENLTSYEQWILQRENKNEIVIYSGGFPHRSLQKFLKKLSSYLYQDGKQDIPVYLWGDIDIGGIKIFNYIRDRYFPLMQSLLMNIETLQHYQESAMKLDDHYRTKLQKMLFDSNYSNWHPLIEKMLQLNIRLEQESIVEVADVLE